MWELIGKTAVLLLCSKLAWSLLKGFYSSVFAVLFKLHTDLSRTGKWAVVTGATDGIGKQYAFQLARSGLNIVLISRTAAKLENVAREIKEKYPVEVKVIAADYTKLDIYDRIAAELSGLDIGVLVNNVGMSYDHPEYLMKVSSPEEFSNTLLNINIQSVNRMTFIVLPGMQERKRGVIINISSLSAILPTPLLTIYASTKAYVKSFSRCLDMELKGTGVSVQCVLPGLVATNMSKVTRTSFLAPSPSTFVNQAITTVGVEKITAGYVGHKLQIYFIEILENYLPGWILESMVLSEMSALRKKALRRKEREAKKE